MKFAEGDDIVMGLFVYARGKARALSIEEVVSPENFAATVEALEIRWERMDTVMNTNTTLCSDEDWSTLQRNWVALRDALRRDIAGHRSAVGKPRSVANETERRNLMSRIFMFEVREETLRMNGIDI